MLHELQTAFVQALFDEGKTLSAEIVDGRLGAAERLTIYRHNVFTNLRSALQSTYPVVERIVGAGFFYHAADQFVRETPSQCGDLNAFGREFGDFLAAYPYAQTLPYLPDVAKLEWAWHETFSAGAQAAFDPATLMEVSPEQLERLRFHFQPAMRLMQSAYPLFRIWEVNQPEFSDEFVIDWEAGGDSILLYRDGVQVVVRQLSSATYACLMGLYQGNTLQEAIERAWAQDAAFNLQDFLLLAVQGNLITKFYL